MDHFVVDVTYPITIRYSTLDGYWLQCLNCPTCFPLPTTSGSSIDAQAVQKMLDHTESEHWNSGDFEYDVSPAP